MAPESFLDGRVLLYPGDCLEVLSELTPASIDSCVTDPPYHLTSIVKRFGAADAAPAKAGKTGAYKRASAGFMGKQWDGGDVAFRPETWAAVYRVLKPGAHLVAFGGTRTYHRMACAIEDAGFEIRDQLQWLYGSGFPKSHDVSKGIDRAAGATREIIEQGAPVKRMIPGADQHKEGWEKNNGREFVPSKTAAATDEAREWEGWGTALKPACEPIVLARKPLSEGTVAANVLRWGCGALNIDACRIVSDAPAHDVGRDSRGDSRLCTCPLPTDDQRPRSSRSDNLALSVSSPRQKNSRHANAQANGRDDVSPQDSQDGCRPSARLGDEHTRRAGVAAQDVPASPGGADKSRAPESAQSHSRASSSKPCPVHGGLDIQRQGRWPANVIHDGSEEVVGAFPDVRSAGDYPSDSSTGNDVYGMRVGRQGQLYSDSGSAARFFYTAKADADDRLGSKHPTVKPLDLMQYLVRLVTPPGGLVLDPFAGTGTTGEAAWREGFRAILIEREPEYLNDIERRMALCLAGPGERSRESNKAKMKDKPADNGPLFAGGEPL